MTDLTPWNNPEAFDCFTGAPVAFGPADYGPSYRVADTRPNLIDALEESWAMPQAARATRLSARAVLRRLGHAASVTIARAISGDGFYLISGAMVALDLVLVIWLVRR